MPVLVGRNIIFREDLIQKHPEVKASATQDYLCSVTRRENSEQTAVVQVRKHPSSDDSDGPRLTET